MNSGFQETITVTAPGEASRIILAVVEREDPNPQLIGGGFGSKSDGVRPFPGNGVRLFIKNDPEKGLTSIKEGYLTVDLPIRLGESNSTLTVTTILKQDLGSFYLEAVK